MEASDEVARIRTEHVATGDPGDPHCGMCSSSDYPIWPCDARIMFDEITHLTAALAAAEQEVAALEPYKRAFDIMREWAERYPPYKLLIHFGLLDTVACIGVVQGVSRDPVQAVLKADRMQKEHEEYVARVDPDRDPKRTAGTPHLVFHEDAVQESSQ